MINIEKLIQNHLDGEFKEKFPAALKQYEEQIKSTVRPFVRLVAKPENTKLWESKFGGDPYIPLGYEYPTNSKGQSLGLLAQINFEDMPSINDFPEKGILQFFVNFTEESPDYIGMNFDDQTKQENFRVIYHKEVDKNSENLMKDFSFLTEDDMECSPIMGEYKVVPEVSFEPISISSYDFSEVVSSEVEDYIIDNDLDDLEDFCTSTGHKFGGYPFFTQSDPREYEDDYKDLNVLLLQIDTDDSDGVEIMWGDSGVGNFFIKQKDLKGLNFSNVLYNWDCY